MYRWEYVESVSPHTSSTVGKFSYFAFGWKSFKCCLFCLLLVGSKNVRQLKNRISSWKDLHVHLAKLSPPPAPPPTRKSLWNVFASKTDQAVFSILNSSSKSWKSLWRSLKNRVGTCIKQVWKNLYTSWSSSEKVVIKSEICKKAWTRNESLTVNEFQIRAVQNVIQFWKSFEWALNSHILESFQRSCEPYENFKEFEEL